MKRVVSFINFGTLEPLIIIIACIIALIRFTNGTIGWERPLLYECVSLSACLGFWALIQMARNPVLDRPSVFLLSLIYQKGFMIVFWQAAAIIAYTAPPRELTFYDQIAYLFLLASSASMISVNCLLFFGRTRGWLETPTDPLPFRRFFKGKHDER